MNFSATKHPVANRDIAPDDFLEALVQFGRTADRNLFAPRRTTEPEIYDLIRPKLGPWESIEHRVAGMLEALRITGMFESSGKLDTGRDTNNPAENSSVTISAGPFQVSANSLNHGQDLKDLVRKVVGTLDPEEFQKAMRSNWQLAIEYAARDFRHTLRANGPLLRGEIVDWLRRDAVAEFQELIAGNKPEPVDMPNDEVPVDTRSEGVFAKLQPEVIPYMRKLVRLAAANGVTIIATSGLRTYAEQNALYEQGRSKPGNIVTNARGGYSSHNFATAVDFTIFKDKKPVWESPLYKKVGELGESIGLSWGGRWDSEDLPHFYLVPQWAKGLSESQMLAELRERHEEGRAIFTA